MTNQEKPTPDLKEKIGLELFELFDAARRTGEPLTLLVNAVLTIISEEYRRGYHDGRGERDFTDKEIYPKGL